MSRILPQRLTHSVFEILKGVLFADLVTALVSNYPNPESTYCPGMGSSDSDHEIIHAKAARLRALSPHGRTVSNDVSRWEYAVGYWLARFDLRCQLYMRGVTEEDPWGRMLVRYHRAEAQPYLKVPGGELYCYTGVCNKVWSGRFLTAMSNSIMRRALGLVVSYETCDKLGIARTGDCITMGDDAVESEINVEIQRSLYAHYGFTVKHSDVVSPNFDFCSHIYTGKAAIFSNTAKMLYRLLRRDYEFNEFQQCMELIRHNTKEERREVFDLLFRVGWLDASSVGTALEILRL
jgi:hypothetical protein